MKFDRKSCVLVLGLVLLFALASRPVTWAAPGQNPYRQTVPSPTPIPPPTSPPTEEPPPPPPPTATSTSTPTATPTAEVVVAPTVTEEPTATPTETATATPSPTPTATATATSTPSPTPSATPEQVEEEPSLVLSPTDDGTEPDSVVPDEERGFPFCWVGLGLIILGALLWLFAKLRR